MMEDNVVLRTNENITTFFLVKDNKEIPITVCERKDKFYIVTFDDSIIDELTSETFTGIMEKIYFDASKAGLDVKCDKELFFKKILNNDEDKLVSEVEPIIFDGEIKLDEMSLYMCIEEPVREACKTLSDKKIVTLMSSANKNDVSSRNEKIAGLKHVRGENHFNIGNGYAWIMIDWQTLSPDNKKLFTQLNKGEIPIPLTETERTNFEHNCAINNFPVKQSELIKFFEILNFYKFLEDRSAFGHLEKTCEEDSYFDSVRNGYACYDSLNNHGDDYRVVVIRYPIDETTKVSDVRRYFDSIVSKLCLQPIKEQSMEF